MPRLLMKLIIACCVSVMVPANAASPVWESHTHPLPATKKTAPFSWTKAPDGRGEFIFFVNCAEEQSSAQRIGERTFLATTAGVLCIPDHSAPVLVPAVYGQPAAIVGVIDGLLWVQCKDFSLLAIDPLTFAIITRIPSPGCPCFHIETSGFWCFDSAEMGSSALGTRMKNRRPVATAIIEYDRAGKEKLRFVPGKDFPEHTEIFSASVDAEAVWVQAAPFISESPTRHTREYGAAKIYRIDRTSGAMQEIKGLPVFSELNFLYYLPDRLVWINDVWGNEKPAILDQLDKKTLVITKKVQLPDCNFRSKLYFQGHNVWCGRYHGYVFGTAPGETISAIFDLNDGHRIHASAAGQPPCELTVHSRVEDMLIASGNDAERVWIIGGKTLYEMRDDGIVVSRTIADVGMVENSLWGQPLYGLFLYKLAGNENDLGCLNANAGTVTVYATEGDTFFLAADERRAWFVQGGDTDCHFITFGKNLPLRNISFPHTRDMSMWGELVAIGNELYYYCGENFYCANAHTGAVTRLASWQIQKPAKLEQFDNVPESAFALHGKKIVFNMSSDNHNHHYRVFYDSMADKWSCVPQAQEQGELDFDRITTPHGVFSTTLESNTLWQATENGWTRAGNLPFPTYRFSCSHSTEKYLYINSPVGLYRIAWADLLKP